MEISFKIDGMDADHMSRVVARVLQERPQTDRMSLVLDLSACHANGMPLDFQAMADAPRSFDFWHDIHGIQRHIDRETGKLQHCFVPRFARRVIA